MMLKVDSLCAGYGRKIVLQGVSFEVKAGSIVSLIGPNGSGKSTVLRTILGQIKSMGGTVSILECDMSAMKLGEIARAVSMVMTDRIDPQFMTCRQVVASGRYPYTGRFGILGAEDEKAVDDAIALVGADSIAEEKFSTVSDGQKQRVMLARAVAQDTDILVLDEPTSFLDMYYKLDLMKIIYGLARNQKKAVLMSMHELDLVRKVSDLVVCLDGSTVVGAGSVERIFAGSFIQRLYGLRDDEFDPATGMVRLNLDHENSAVEVKKCSERGSATESSGDLSSPVGKAAKVIMVQGTMSSAGKSLLVAGLCRIFAQDGYRVVPFKSQNMALNSFITRDGLEMGRAQVMQAEAAGVDCDVAMNPILLKPTSDVGCQVIVNGEVLGNMKAREYFEYKPKLIPHIVRAFRTLEEKADIIVIEGAGSPAEINLRENDIVNMGLAELVDAPVLLVGDIDRGGVFAQLAGTVELLQPEERNRIKGLVINKFRGDKSILDPGIEMIEKRLNVPVTGVVPYMNIVLDDEDSLSRVFEKKSASLVNIAVVRFPKISNFTDFTVFEQFDQVGLHYVTDPRELEHMDAVILPGSKNTIDDLLWMRQSGMEAAVKKFAEHGLVFGICGGYQMLGNSISDPRGVESGKSVCGMGLLPVSTVLQEEKIRTRTEGVLRVEHGELSFLDGEPFSGYEIHMGTTCLDGGSGRSLPEPGILTACGNVAGTYIHGIFDEGNIAFKVAAHLAEKKGVALDGSRKDYREFKERQYDILADTIRGHVDMEGIYRMLRPARIRENAR
ncbi:MAG: cobyric acid synthase [Treponema sp.]|nr:cobyric acid synthase [Treponema sp.]